ncbi:MAG: acyl-CoA dehydrogenase family protein [Gemmobacter sp.]|nr:acyl-CoA dehydrogenase family protein [Gemmobacter sp.]
MDFRHSEEHQLLADSLRRFLADASPMTARNTAAFAFPYHIPTLWAGLARLGIPGAFVTEAHGGFGGTPADIMVVFEEIGRNLCIEPLLGTLLGARLLERLGRGDLLEGVIAGSERLALAVNEPQVACDLDHLAATAHRVDGSWRLQGQKSAIYGAPAATLVLVVARTDDHLGVFALREPALIHSAMVDGGGTADLVLSGLRAECLAQDARPAIEEALDLGRLALCAETLGAMSHLMALTKDYLQTRKQFGQALSTFQALRHRAVDMQVDLEQVLSITISAMAEFDGPQRARHVAMAKALTGKLAARFAEEAIQLHGGIGMTWEYPGSHYAKRLVMIDHQLGDRHDHIARMIRADRQDVKAAT